eukprot:TRINITY_DN1474_c0_g2_i2.p1 TRINITY_DN1474_c0_g2~~TRINITY_DN1474_c0_g2_i2.p1  ORF type:complete len:874 (-),score=182.53 TRINITY_DN1474_c0_g2_i2:602-3223(-)
MVAQCAAALGTRMDRYAAETLLNAPHNDQVLYKKWLEQHEVANEEGRRWWCFCALAMMATSISFWDWVIMIIVFAIVPFALLTRSGKMYTRFGWMVNPSMLVWVFLRLSVVNVGNTALRNQVYYADTIKLTYSLGLSFAWVEVSGLRFSAWLVHHLLAHSIVHINCGPNASCITPLLSLIMFCVFCYRRYWGSAITDQVTALVAREELQQSRVETRFLRNLSETKSVFLRTLCHELRNPMTAVHGNTEILVQRLGQLTERAQVDPTPELISEILKALPRMLKFGKNALSSTHHMSAVLNQTLTSAGLEAKHGIEISPSDRTMVNVRESMGAVLQMFQVVADRKGIELQLVLPPGRDLVVQTNDNSLKQNVINLLGNALKFTETGKIVISVCTLIDAAQTLLQCSVSDTGIGMTEEEQANLFSAFSQANPEIGAQYGGSGLGLHIVWESLKELKGSIRVKSIKHEGSTFTFDLPVALPEGQRCSRPLPKEMPSAEHVEQVEQLETSVGDAPKRRRRKSVLIVDDEKLLRDLLQDQLSAVMECRVTIASNGAEAVEQAGKEKFDVILMDVNMPVMGGLEATRAIRAGSGIAVNARTPIVGLSANSLEADLQLAKDAGMDSYLTKPYQLSDLCKTINSHTSNAHTCITPTTPEGATKPTNGIENPDDIAAPWVKSFLVDDMSPCGPLSGESTNSDLAVPWVTSFLADEASPGDSIEDQADSGIGHKSDPAVDVMLIADQTDHESDVAAEGLQSILVVDDNPNVRAVLVDLIQMLAPDVLVKEATDGLEAVELAAKFDFELIFMDLHMPHMGGEEATAQIRSSNLNAECPIVLVSGTVSGSEKETRSWATDFVSKPYSITHIQKLLEDFGIIAGDSP